ncbi:helix-turn-helix domain-containing protein [Caldivirga sp.]|uniref:helix-turn-helix domain-containing protein n=1 Tax=Caldivirga sp. TaxID=2080243 RepID=UPI003D0C3D55
MPRLVRLSALIRHVGDWSMLSGDFSGVHVVGLSSFPVRPGEVSLEVVSIHGDEPKVVREFISRLMRLKDGNIVKVLHVNRVSKSNYEVFLLLDYSGVLKYIILNNGGLLAYSHVHSGLKEFTAYYLNYNDAEETCSEFRRINGVELVECSVDWFRGRGPLIMSYYGGLFRHVLTDNEYRVLKLAYEMGYFNGVRQVRLSDLASLLNLSKATVDHHVRSGLRKIVRLYLSSINDFRLRSTNPP